MTKLKIGDKISYNILYTFKTGLILSYLLTRFDEILDGKLDISQGNIVDIVTTEDEINYKIFDCIYGKKDFVITSEEEINRILQANFIDRVYERTCEEVLGWTETLPKIIQKYK